MLKKIIVYFLLSLFFRNNNAPNGANKMNTGKLTYPKNLTKLNEPSKIKLRFLASN